MPTLLHIDSSPLPSSISRELTAEFVNTWTAAHPDGTVIHRDLANNPPTPLDAQWIAANFTPEVERTAEQRALLAPSDQLIAELNQADEYVFGVAMHNFSIPSTLKLWIDQIARAGKTFSYASGTPEGLLKGKKVTFLVASGGVYDPATVMASFNFVEPYLRTVFGFLGVTEVKFISAGGAAALNYGQIDRETFLQPHVESIRAHFQAA
jgi:FMN-dependent NADH-azoreductase